MTNLELTYSPYSLKLAMPFYTSAGKMVERKGFIISLKDLSGAEGIGEAAPLPEFGSESYEDDAEALENINLRLRFDLNDLLPSVQESLSEFSLSPRFKERSGTGNAKSHLRHAENNSQ